MKQTDMKLGTRLAIGFSLVLLMLTLISGVGYWRLRLIDGTVQTMVGGAMQKERLFAEWAAATNLNGVRTLNVIDGAAPARQQQLKADIKTTSARISTIQKRLEQLGLDGAEQTLFSAIGAERKSYLAARDGAFAVAPDAAEPMRAAARGRLEGALQQYVASIRKLADYQNTALDQAAARTTAQVSQSATLLAALGACATLCGVAVALVIGASVKRQLGGEPGHAVALANRMAGGDLGLEIGVRAGDSSSMLYALKEMRDSIAGIVGEVRSGTDQIASASGQIAAGNRDLSARTEQQAGALEETASAMEDLARTMQRNADQARQADQLVQSASAVARRGGAVVGQMVDTMDAIHSSANRITDIIAVIDGIAFQTNILALNAAVEAARAGEQGRGFAVVAGEVRVLAQRSANAAREIKTLIGASIAEVKAGAGLAGEAGATMRDIVDSVGSATAIMRDIAAASQEQSSGIAQINRAIGQMDQTTQQNANLVEDAALATEALRAQADTLARVVHVFRLDAAPTAASAQLAWSATA